MLKKVISFLICILLLSVSLPGYALADENDFNKEVETPGFVVIEEGDPDTLIYAKNPDRLLAPGSTTKIMTCILTLENCSDLSEMFTIPAEAVHINSSNSKMGIKEDESVSIHDLLYGLMLNSGNDAAIALAIYNSGSVADFAVKMNEKAAELGMENTCFVNASGVFKAAHKSTARDMAILANYAMQNETFREIVSTYEYTVEPNDVRTKPLYLVNGNDLLNKDHRSRYYEYAIGIKTGSTVQGGKCLLAAAEKNGVVLIASMLGLLEGGSRSDRLNIQYNETKKLFEAAFAQYMDVPYSELGLDSFTTEVNVENFRMTDPENGALILNADFSGQNAYIRESTKDGVLNGSVELKYDITYNENITAPISAGDVLGSVTISYANRPLFTSDLTASRDVEAYNPADESVLEAAKEESAAHPIILISLAIILLVCIAIASYLLIFRKKKGTK